MIPFLNLLILTLVVTACIKLGIIKLNDERYIFHKGIIFVLLLATQIIIELVINYFKKCDNSISRSFNRGFDIALIGVIGYSLFIDISRVTQYQETFVQIDKSSNKYTMMIVASIILLIFIHQIILLMFQSNDGLCQK
jgi:hypothetical protein